MSEHVQVTTTADSREAAEALAKSAVQARLAGTAQVDGPRTSYFWHHGEFGEGEEWVVILKTTASRYADLEAHLLTEHPWDNPEVTALPITNGSDGYLSWLDRSTSPIGDAADA